MKPPSFDDLANILDAHNKTTLEKLLGVELKEAKTKDRTASVVVPISEGDGEPSGCRCYCGTTTHAANCADLISRCLDLQVESGVSARVAVGSVLDKATEGQDLPIVLVVGINYGQGLHYASNPTMLVENTGMLSRTKKVLEVLRGEGCCEYLPDPKENFHLVAANFFPWITYNSWGGSGFLNAIEEAMLLKCVGHKDPVNHISHLIDRVKPIVVMFHGANNIVPSLGLIVSKSHNHTEDDMSFILCDNLAPPGAKVSNALVLCRKNQREILYQTNFDE